MQTTNAILKMIRKNQENIDTAIIRKIIKDHKPIHDKMKQLYYEYIQDESSVEIYKRTFKDKNKVNNKLANDYIGDIIDTKVGFLVGKPIVYGLDKTKYKNEKKQLDEGRFAKNYAALDNIVIENHLNDIDADTVRRASLCGVGARLLYIDKNAKTKIMDVKPYEVVFIYDRSIDELQYAMRYYDISYYDKNDKDEWIERESTRVEWYDKKNITFYVKDDNDRFVLDDTEPTNPLPHQFSDIPMIPFPNNTDMLSDVEKVEDLIDAFDRAFSDVNNELEEFRLAYMVMKGYKQPDPETMEKIRLTGAFSVDKDGDIKFITKDLNDNVVEHHLDRLEESIYYFAKSVNFRDEAFAGNLSGVAMKFKIFGLEVKCAAMERKFKAASMKMFKLLCEKWNETGKTDKINYLDITMKFTRNFPMNIKEEAESTVLLRGQISEETRLGQLSFIDDAEEEIRKMEEEQQGNIDLDEKSGGEE